MMRFYVDNHYPRSKFDILYGLKEEESSNYSIYYLNNKTLPDLKDPYSFYVRDQSSVMNTEALMLSMQKNNGITLFNKIPKTLEEMVQFLDLISTTTGAFFAIGRDNVSFLRKFEEDYGFFKCPIEELPEVLYPKLYVNPESTKPKVYFHGRIAEAFYRFCVRVWSKGEAIKIVDNRVVQQPDIGPFEGTEDISEASIFVTFEELSREYLRMLSTRLDNIYVPFTEETSIFDPRSFFKVGNMEYLNHVTKSDITDHEIDAQFKNLFNDMLDHINMAFIEHKTSTVNNMILNGSVDLFNAMYYNLNRTV